MWTGGGGKTAANGLLGGESNNNSNSELPTTSTSQSSTTNDSAAEGGQQQTQQQQEQPAAGGSGAGAAMDDPAEDYETKRERCLRDLLDLERQWADLRKCLYNERLEQVEKRLAELKEGRAKEYTSRLKELEDNYKERLDSGNTLRSLQLRENDIRLRCGRESAYANFENNRRLLVDQITDDIRQSIARLEDQKQSSDLSIAIWMSPKRFPNSNSNNSNNNNNNSGSKKIGKIHRSGGHQQQAKRLIRKVQPPYIIYQLPEGQIENDWDTIRKAMIKSELAEKHRATLTPLIVPNPPPPATPLF